MCMVTLLVGTLLITLFMAQPPVRQSFKSTNVSMQGHHSQSNSSSGLAMQTRANGHASSNANSRSQSTAVQCENGVIRFPVNLDNNNEF